MKTGPKRIQDNRHSRYKSSYIDLDEIFLSTDHLSCDQRMAIAIKFMEKHMVAINELLRLAAENNDTVNSIEYRNILDSIINCRGNIGYFLADAKKIPNP